MTTQELFALLASGKITPQEAEELLRKVLPKSNGSNWKATLHVSRNKSGGVFIRHPRFVEHSATKGKEYVAGINLPPNVAKVLFGDKSVYEEIAKAVNALT